MKKKFLATLGGVLAPALTFAQGTTSTYSVPQGVKDALDDLTDASSALAGEVAPKVAEVALAFIGIGIVFWVARYLWRKSQGRS